MRPLAIYVSAILLTHGVRAAEGDDAAPRLRRPAALAVQGDRLFVANRCSGSVSIVALTDRKVVGEADIAKQLEDIVCIPESNRLLAVDSGAEELLLLEPKENSISVVERLPIRGSLVTVQVASDGAFCSVASLWARRVTLIEIRDGQSAAEAPHLAIRSSIDLPFAPRLQWLSKDGTRLVVADSFGGKLAAIDPQTRRLLAVRSLDGHNIRGLAADHHEQELLVAHQMLNEAVPTTRDRIFWGNLMQNLLRSVTVDDLFAEDAIDSKEHAIPSPDLSRWSLYPLGRPGAATGDPAAIAVTQDGKAILALSGVNQIAFRTAPLQPFFHRPVGRRPSDVALDEEGRFAYVASMFDDSISVFDFEAGDVIDTISLGSQPELTEADHGEMMFYDATFSLDGWYSCHSCHTDGHTSGLRNDNLSDETYGAPKRVLSLLGVGDTAPWTWSGGQESLEDQSRKSITVTMRDHEGLHATDENIAALAAYMRTLSPPPSLLQARGEVDEAAEERGSQVFQSQGCAECHRPPTYTTPDVYDINLADEQGRREFNPPSLRGVSQRDALFHDNRASSLEDVLIKFKHPSGAGELPPSQRADLLHFLRSLWLRHPRVCSSGCAGREMSRRGSSLFSSTRR
jgi:cytochrome c peroxidase